MERPGRLRGGLSITLCIVTHPYERASGTFCQKKQQQRQGTGTGAWCMKRRRSLEERLQTGLLEAGAAGGVQIVAVTKRLNGGCDCVERDNDCPR